MNIKQNILDWLVSLGISEKHTAWLDQLLTAIAIAIIAFIADYFVRNFILKAVDKIVKKSKNKWDDILLSHRVLTPLCHIVAPIIIIFLLTLSYGDEDMRLINAIVKICQLWIVFNLSRALVFFTDAAYQVYLMKQTDKQHSLKGLVQVVQIIVMCIATIIMISIIVDRSPLTLLAGMGAIASILMLIFQDVIKGFAAGLQLSMNRMVKEGDWITVQSAKADGIVREISLITVKVENWDKTITTIPAYTLISGSFQNWQNMSAVGGRRILRTISIDINSVRFCDAAMLARLANEPLMAQWLSHDEPNRTNIGAYRAYLEAYISQHPKIRQDMIHKVCHEQATEYGATMEIDCFTSETTWIPYDQVQSEIMDNALAALSLFDLRGYQRLHA